MMRKGRTPSMVLIESKTASERFPHTALTSVHVTNDWPAILVPHSSCGRRPPVPETLQPNLDLLAM